MKKHLTTTFCRLCFGSLFLLSTFVGKAQTISPDSVRKGEPALIKYLGTQDDMVVFNISYSNPQGTAFHLTVKDQDGTELYQQIFHEKNFYKQFRLPRSERSKLSFVIRNGKESDVVKTFEINVNSRFVQDIAVKKLD